MLHLPEFNSLIYLAVLLLSGLLFGRLAKLVRLPNVTGYIVAGLVLGPYVLNVIPSDTVASLSVVSEMALAFIAFTIGCGFKRSYFRRVGAVPVVIAICEALAAVFLVQIALVVSGQSAPFAIVLGAIAAATAPAATLMVIKQYGAKGPVTDTLMSVVAIDDAVALVAFSFCVTIAKAMTGSGENLALSIAEPFIELLADVLIGVVSAVLLKLLLRFFKKRGNRLIIATGFVFLASGIASSLGYSALLPCMLCGATLCNISAETESILALCDEVTPPLFVLFFSVSGAGLNLTILPQIGLVGVIYIVFRVIGKLFGAFIGAKVTKAPPAVAKYLGPTLIPQAGVAIGLTIVAQTAVPEYAEVIRAVVLCGTLIYELIGPVITKVSLTRAKEIKKPETPAEQQSSTI